MICKFFIFKRLKMNLYQVIILLLLRPFYPKIPKCFCSISPIIRKSYYFLLPPSPISPLFRNFADSIELLWKTTIRPSHFHKLSRPSKTAILQGQYEALNDVNRVQLAVYFAIGKYLSKNTRKGVWGLVP